MTNLWFHFGMIVCLLLVPAALTYFFPKTWVDVKLIYECKNRKLIFRTVGNFDSLLMGLVLFVGFIEFFVKSIEIEVLTIFILLILSLKFAISLFEKNYIEISKEGVKQKKIFSVSFIAWSDIKEINVANPVRRIMFRSDREKIVISLNPNEEAKLGFDDARVAGLIARFARKKLRNRTDILWCT